MKTPRDMTVTLFDDEERIQIRKGSIVMIAITVFQPDGSSQVIREKNWLELPADHPGIRVRGG